MIACVGPQASALRAKHQRHPLRSQRVLEIGIRIAGETNPPEPCFADLLERAGKVHHPNPGYALQSARSGFRQSAALGR
jgi:hypothetical protein